MKKLAAYIVTFLLPTLAFAQLPSSTTQTLGGITTTATDLVLQLTKGLVAAAILVFIFGVVKYIIAGDEEGKASAQKIILYGVIGLFAIVAVWGLVALLGGTIGVGSDTAPDLACPPGFLYVPGAGCQ